MTVEEKLDDGRIQCRWESGKQLKRDDFDPAMLVKDVPARSSGRAYPSVSKGL